jgi:serine/threonine-protein kinase
VDRRADLYAAGVMLWELATGRPLFETGDDFSREIERAVHRVVPPPSRYADVAPALEAVILKALEREPGARYESAAAMGDALEIASPAAKSKELAAFVARVGAAALGRLDVLIAGVEQLSDVHVPPDRTIEEADGTKPETAPFTGTVDDGARDLAPTSVRAPNATAPFAPPPPTPAAIARGGNAIARGGNAIARGGNAIAPTRVSAAPPMVPPPVAAPASATQVSAATPPVAASVLSEGPFPGPLPPPQRATRGRATGAVVAVAVVLIAAIALVASLTMRGFGGRRLLGGPRAHEDSDRSPASGDAPDVTGTENRPGRPAGRRRDRSTP